MFVVFFFVFFFAQITVSNYLVRERWGRPGYLRSQFTQDFIILWRILTQCVLPCFGNALVFALWRTTLYATCKLTALSVNHAGKHSKDCFRGAVFVDTLAGKLDMRLRMAEPVQVDLSKMELGGNIYLLSTFSPSLWAVWFLSLSLPSFRLFTSLYMFLLLFSLTKHTKLPLTSSITHTSLLLSSHFWPSPCFPFTPLLYCSPGLQLLGNSWLSMRGMQLTN